jgi:CPA2 family monovalent cation:H+ antiporter-2
LLLAQGGEFAFIVIGLARGKGLLEHNIATSAIAVAGLSMMVTPLLALAARRVGDYLEPLDHDGDTPQEEIAELRDHVIIGGFGRVGQMVARVLDSEQVPWVALDTNGHVVAEHREKGHMVYFGDASRREMLERAGGKSARAFVVTLNGVEQSERMVAEILKLRPKASVLARARDAEHAARLMRLGCMGAIPEAVETSLLLAGRVLESLDIPEDAADRRIADIRIKEVEVLRKAARVAKN